MVKGVVGAKGVFTRVPTRATVEKLFIPVAANSGARFELPITD